MTKVEIIDETVKFYSEDTKRRSTEDGSCVYNSSDGRHCAVGRCLLPKYKELGTDFEANNDGIDSLFQAYDGLDKLLEERYRGHSFTLTFWSELQMIHDEEAYWDENGLTTSGQEHVNEMREKYGEREIDEIRALAERFGVTESQITLTKDK